MSKIRETLEKHLGLIVIITLITGLLVFLIYKNITVSLTITVNPNDATVTVDGNENQGSFTKRVLKGEHLIRIGRAGFETKEQKININTQTELSYSLVKITGSGEVQTPATNPFEVAEFEVSSVGAPLAIDRFTQHIIELSLPKKVFYSTPVMAFSYSRELVALIDGENRNAIKILIYPSGAIRNTFSDETTKDLTAVALFPNPNTIAWLSNYNLGTAASDLYISDTDNFSPQLIRKTYATDIVAARENMIVLFTHGEALDMGEIEIVDTSSNRTILTNNANKASLSLDANQLVFYTSGSLHLYDFQSGNTLNRQTNTVNVDFAWFKTNTIIALDKANKTNPITLINMADNSIVAVEIPDAIGQNQFAKILGVSEGAIYLQDINGELVAIKPS